MDARVALFYPAFSQGGATSKLRTVGSAPWRLTSVDRMCLLGLLFQVGAVLGVVLADSPGRSGALRIALCAFVLFLPMQVMHMLPVLRFKLSADFPWTISVFFLTAATVLCAFLFHVLHGRAGALPGWKWALGLCLWVGAGLSLAHAVWWSWGSYVYAFLGVLVPSLLFLPLHLLWPIQIARSDVTVAKAWRQSYADRPWFTLGWCLALLVLLFPAPFYRPKTDGPSAADLWNAAGLAWRGEAEGSREEGGVGDEDVEGEASD